MKKDNIYLDGIVGLVVGDALGVPVEFMSRQKLKDNPVIGLVEGGAHEQPLGAWSDDSSMALATLDGLLEGYNPDGIMQRFLKWFDENEYTSHGYVFDCGGTCGWAIEMYKIGRDCHKSGQKDEYSNGNGSLMRILPMCLYCYDKKQIQGISDQELIGMIHETSALTHAHERSLIGCGIYYFLVESIIENDGDLQTRLQKGINKAFEFYGNELSEELSHYNRLKRLDVFMALDEDEIDSTGYVVRTLEAAVWCLLNTTSFEEAVLKAVNLGDDTDTVGAVAGGLAGLFYGIDSIPNEWVDKIARIEWIKELCERTERNYL